jgi:aspartyl protease
LVSFSYRREFSHVLGEILRPVASVELRALRGHWFPALMYIDSGADMTLVPSDFGKLLGMDLSKNRASLAGVTSAPLRVSLQSADIKVGRTIENAMIAVAKRNDVPYLLGREGLFKAFEIVFEEYKSLTSFTRYS